MMDELELAKQTGRFTIFSGREVYGELTLRNHILVGIDFNRASYTT